MKKAWAHTHMEGSTTMSYIFCLDVYGLCGFALLSDRYLYANTEQSGH